jgi:hypothetical protein
VKIAEGDLLSHGASSPYLLQNVIAEDRELSHGGGRDDIRRGTRTFSVSAAHFQVG